MNHVKSAFIRFFSVIQLFTAVLLFGGLASHQAQAQCPTDSLNLVLFFNATNGPTWTTTWNLTSPYNTWAGVTVDANRCVTGIRLPSNNLTGNIPAAIGSLTRLQVLDLRNNVLTGTLTASIGSLSQLSYLDLSRNNFSGAIPASVGSLTQLRSLLLNNNKFNALIPAGLGALTVLERLDLSNNLLTGALSTPFASITTLNKVLLNNNLFTGVIPATFSTMTGLDTLDLSFNQLTGAVPPAFSSMSGLRFLGLANNRLTSMPPMTGIAGMNTLKLENNRFMFDAIEANLGLPRFSYAPQDSVGTVSIKSTCPETNLFDTATTVLGKFNVYSWFKYPGPVFESGPTTADSVLDIINVLPTDAGTYICHITNSQCTDPASPETNLTLYYRATIVKVFSISANVISKDTTICFGAAPPVIKGTLVEGVSGGVFLYQWQASPNGVTWSNTATTKDLPLGAITDTTFFRRLITGDCVDTSNVVKVNVVPQYGANTIASNQTICGGALADTIKGSRPTVSGKAFGYQWQISTDNGATWVNTGTGIDYRPSMPITDTARVRRIVLGGCRPDTSNVVFLFAITEIEKNTIEKDQFICKDAVPELIVGSKPTGATGIYTFYWQFFRGDTLWVTVDSSGASYLPDVVTDTTRFRRVAVSGCQKDTSNTVTIFTTTDLTPFNDNIKIKRLKVCYGDSMVFEGERVPASGGFFYLWQASQDSLTWKDLDSTQNYVLQDSVLDTLFVPLPEEFYVRRLVVDSCVQYVSNLLKIDLVLPIKNNILSPDTLTICETDTTWAILDTLPTGGMGRFKYFWQISFDSLRWGARDTTRSMRYFPLPDTTYFRRLVLDSCFIDTSNVVKINVIFNYGLNTITPSDSIICSGDTSLVVFGTPPRRPRGSYIYQWEYSPDSVTWFTYDSSTIHFVPDTLVRQTSYFRRIVIGGCALDTSNTVKVVFIENVEFNLIEKDHTVCEGDSIPTLIGTIPVNYDSTFIIDWQRSLDSLDWVSAGGDSINFEPGVAKEDIYYRRAITRRAECEPNYSNPVKIIVIKRIQNNRIFDDQTICLGDTVDTLVGNTPTGGNGKYDYLWQRRFVKDTVWESVSTKEKYGPGRLANTAFFRRIVTSQCFSDTSVQVKITVNQPIRFNTIKTDQTVCARSIPGLLEGTVILDTLSEFGLFRYKWQVSKNRKDWVDLPRSNEPNYQPPALDSTRHYRRIITNDCFQDSSNVLVINVLRLPEVEAGSDTTIDIGFSVRLKATGAITYRWSPAESLDNDTTSVPLATPFITTDYVVEGTDINGCKNYDTIQVRVDGTPKVRTVDAIVPNGDQLNEFLYVEGLERYPDNTLTIFNRWGEEVFTKKNYSNDWNGVNQNGNPLPEGVYFYMLRFKITTKVVSGSFMIFR